MEKDGGVQIGWLAELTARSHDRAWVPALVKRDPVESCLLGTLQRIAPVLHLGEKNLQSRRRARTFVASLAPAAAPPAARRPIGGFTPFCSAIARVARRVPSGFLL